jgi:signal-transduction protein with cAMP-binding, CBS, and nucleotidyltransferase domain
MFDIKTRAIMPLVDAARLFTLYFDLKGINNTYVRFKQLSSLIPNTRNLNCAEAFDFIKIQDPRRSKMKIQAIYKFRRIIKKLIGKLKCAFTNERIEN